MQRVADQIALDRQRVFHEAGGMEGADRLVTGDARSHHLAATRPAGHEMRLDKAGGDAEIRLDEAAVDPDRRAARGGEAEIHMVLVAQREVVFDPDIVQHPRIADQFGHLDALVGAVQAGGDQDGDAVLGDAGRHHRFDHGAEEQAVRAPGG